MIPIGDDNVVGGYKPYVSYSFIALNILIFLVQLATPGNLVCEFAAIPENITSGTDYHTVLTSMFLHGGWMHLIGNMVFLWVFADNIEATIGSTKFLIFYLFGGLAGSLGHIFIESGSVELMNECCRVCAELNPCNLGDTNACPGSIPSLGASGAISAVLGAYLIMFPKSKIKIFAFLFTFRLSALIFLVLWFGEQLLSGLGALGPSLGSGVAWWAHIGGFIFGLVCGFIFKKKANYDAPEIGRDPYV